jgi:predicted nuclease of predicted toxin-antitoxin system
MNLLLDERVTRRLRRDLTEHNVSTIEQAGFKGLKNGALLEQASSQFDVLVTVDRNIEFQQNRSALPMSILILAAETNRYESLSPLIPKALEALKTIKKGEIVKIEF